MWPASTTTPSLPLAYTKLTHPPTPPKQPREKNTIGEPKRLPSNTYFHDANRFKDTLYTNSVRPELPRLAEMENILSKLYEPQKLWKRVGKKGSLKCAAEDQPREAIKVLSCVLEHYYRGCTTHCRVVTSIIKNKDITHLHLRGRSCLHVDNDDNFVNAQENKQNVNVIYTDNTVDARENKQNAHDIHKLCKSLW